MPSPSRIPCSDSGAPPPELCRQLLGWLEEHREAMVRLLVLLARAESPSREPAAQNAVLAMLGKELELAGMRVRRLKAPETVGDHLLARPRSRGGLGRQLLLGHSDTVWPLGTLARMPVTVDEEAVHGPGVFDMKAGLVQAVFALRALHALTLAPPLDPIVLINTDEEVGSRDSTRWIRRLARQCARAWILEPALGPEGKLKTARKGIGGYRLVIHGKAAHAGLDPGEGSSAILEMSHQVQRLFALSDPGRGVTVNVGKIDGGLAANVVAPRVTAMVDVRVPDWDTAGEIDHAIKHLEPVGEENRIEVTGGFGRPPMPPTPRNAVLWELALEVGGSLGLTLDQAHAGGASDGNTTSSYTATLDGLGAVGSGAHAAHEQVSIRGMVERAGLLAGLLLARPTRSGGTQ